MSAKEIKVKYLPLDIVEDGLYCIEQSSPNSFTHGFFKYPCKFIPEIPKWAIRKYTSGKTAPVIYDPFSGSGTTLLEASIFGLMSYGSEIDSTAKLITRVKCTPLSKAQLKKIDSIFTKLLDKINDVSAEKDVAPLDNIEHWFSVKTIDELGRLRYAICTIRDVSIRDFFLVCLASIIKKVSYADDISPKPYVSSKIAKIPNSVAEEFSNVFRKYKEGICEFSSLPNSVKPAILQGGAFGLSVNNMFDLAITSPPYINAFDYARSLRLENIWLGFATEDEIRESKKNYIGTENIKVNKEFCRDNFLTDSPLLIDYLDVLVNIDRKRAEVVNKFFVDMRVNMRLVYNALKPGGQYIIVIGNSSIRKITIESWRVLKEIAACIGYQYLNHISYMIKNPYIRIPREGRGGNISVDHILILQK